MMILLLSAILGGFMLNFMPCALPVLALKLTSFAEQKNRIALVATTSGIIVSFWLLSLISISMKMLGYTLGIGVGFQHPTFIIFLCILLVVFISLTLNRIQLRLPQISASASGNFMSGCIMTFLSVPCTAPFLGSSMVFAMLGSNIVNFAVFTAIGCGFAMPYILLILSPNLLIFLPKAGKWMIYFKTILGAVLVCVLLWLLIILGRQLGLRAVFGLFLLLMLIKFILEESRIKALYKIIGFIILSIISMYLPQAAHREDIVYDRYINEIWQRFDEALIGSYTDQGKVVIVDITSDWCITCQYNKFVLWDKKRIVELLRTPDIIAMRLDATKYDKSIEDYVLNLDMYGIPLNVVYGPFAKDGIILPTLLTYEDLIEAITRARLHKNS